MIINIYNKVVLSFLAALFLLLVVLYDSDFVRQYSAEYSLLILGVLIIYVILSQKFFRKKLSCIEELQSRVTLDPLTGLYNKATTRSIIIDYLNVLTDDVHAFFVIDIDDFKIVNDRYGHLTGDNLLKNIASSIREIFREDDVVGRFGGDEFVVFMRNIPSKEVLIDKANRLCKVLNKNFIGSYGSVSGSIGISMYPRNGRDYYSLFESADKAMYSAKRQGKNCYCIYKEDIDVDGEEFKYTSCRRVNNYDTNVNDITVHIFKALYETSNTDNALKEVLKFMGKHFRVSRAYIYETNEEGTMLSNTFEWRDETIKGDDVLLECLGKQIGVNYLEEFDVNGMHYCNNIDELPEYIKNYYEEQRTTAFVHSKIMEDNNVKGLVGFDWCQDDGRTWTSEEVQSLRLISEIIGVFLRRRKIDKILKMEGDIARILVDSADVISYVIDKNTHRILFVSKKLQEITGAKVGDNCYSAMRENSCSCESCPLYNYGSNESKKTIIMKDKIYDGEVEVTLCNLIWINGSDACAINIKKK